MIFGLLFLVTSLCSENTSFSGARGKHELDCAVLNFANMFDIHKTVLPCGEETVTVC